MDSAPSGTPEHPGYPSLVPNQGIPPAGGSWPIFEPRQRLLRSGCIAQCVGRSPRYQCGHAERTAASQATLLPECSHFLIACELPLVGLSETLKHCGAMGLGHNE